VTVKVPTDKNMSSPNAKGPSAALLGAGDWEPQRVAVERLISEIRAGRPVALRSGRSFALAVAVEALDAPIASRLESLSRKTARLVLPAPRLRRLGFDRSRSGVIAVPGVDVARIRSLSLEKGARFDAPVASASKIDLAALELVHLAFVHPSVVVVPVPAKSLAQMNPLIAEANDILAYRERQAASLHIISRAPVPLEDADATEFVVFRGGEGMRDQVAIIVGQPDMNEPVTVRLHSACLTGDLFGSLKCDCGDQLRHTVKFMAENGGGILLYLDQEGRGNGLSNKIRAYKFQSEGFDTYDADEILGFDHDQRNFDFAAAMLHQLGVKSVRIMTNNPHKIEALKTAGLVVAAEQRIEGRQNDFNLRYLSTKRDRAGHFLTVSEPRTGEGSAKETGSE
jgi:GTP cyclohydrolase II